MAVSYKVIHKELSGWWLNQPTLNILVKIGNLPQVGVKNKQVFETTT